VAGFIQHYAVDLGSTTLRVYSGRAREVRSTPNVAVLDRAGGIRARGLRAVALQGRTPAGFEVVRPVGRSVVTDQPVAVRLLREALWEAAPCRIWESARASVCVSDESTPVERQALLAVCQEAGLRAVQLIPASLAAAAGAGVEVRDTAGALVVDIGTENATAALISAASVVLARTIPQGGAAVDRRLVRHLYEEHDFAVSVAEAERAKIRLTSLPGDDSTLTLKGRELDRGLPRTLTLSVGDLEPAVHEVADDIAELILSVLVDGPEALVHDVCERGVVLVGEGSRLRGLEDRVRRQAQVPVHTPSRRGEVSAVGAWRLMRWARARGVAMEPHRSTPPAVPSAVLSGPGSAMGAVAEADGA
jgi:rod shape-determining protein MreB